MAESTIAMLTEVPALDQRGVELERAVIPVRDADSFAAAGARLKLFKAYLAQVAEVFDPIDRAQIEARKVTIAQRKTLEGRVLEADRQQRANMGEYQAEQERLRVEAEEARRREQERLEAEARIEAERLENALRRTAEEATLAVAIQAEEQGDHEAAEQILEQPVFVPPVMPQPVFAPPVSVVMPQAQGVTFRSVWSAEVVSLMDLVKAVAAGKAPLTLVMANEQALNGMARALKAAMSVPGVKTVERKSASVRT